MSHNIIVPPAAPSPSAVSLVLNQTSGSRFRASGTRCVHCVRIAFCPAQEKLAIEAHTSIMRRTARLQCLQLAEVAALQLPTPPLRARPSLRRH